MQSNVRRRAAVLRSVRTPPAKRTNILVRIIVVLAVTLILLTGSVAAGTFAYFQTVKLPPLNFAGSIRFENTEILSSNRQLLYEMVDPNTGSRILRPLELNPKNPKLCPQGRQTRKREFYYTCRGYGIPAVVRDATIATEDPTFYSNPGFDPLSILRAAYQDLSSGQIQSGASTITQQFVKQYVLHDNSPTFTRKAKELVLAWRMTQKYPKDFILYYYLNSVYYGHLAYGVEAAAQIYFHVDVQHLKLWQAAMIAGMPQAPNNYDPFYQPNPSGQWFSRMLQVLNYMQERGYITKRQERRAEAQAQAYAFHQSFERMQQPDFVTYAIDQFQQMTDANGPGYDHYLVTHLHGLNLNDGLRIVTTLNPALQNVAQQTVTNQVAGLAATQNVTDGALVSISTQPSCYGCILAMVGTANVDKRNTFINMANSPRQPGSSFKVFNYVSAFQKGLSPGTTIEDAPLSVPDSSSPTGYYAPTNYDLTFHGLVSLRTALANSLNIPAVKVELWNGVRRVANTAYRMGISDIWTDNPHCCGYALTLGGMERGVKLLQETAAYGAFATYGIKVPPLSFTEILDRQNGRVLWRASDDPVLRRERIRVAPAADTYLVTSVLSDDQARVMEFGYNSPLQLDRPAAAKTGTTNSYTDNWTVGYTPQLVTGVWVGNANYTPMIDSTGVTGAAPIWHDFMESAFQVLNLPVEGFVQPSSVLSGSQCRLADVPTPGLASFAYGQDLYDAQNQNLPYCTVPSVPGLDAPTQTYVPPAAQSQQQPVQPVQPVQPQTLPPSNSQPSLLPANGQTNSGGTSGTGSGSPPSLLPGH